MDREFAGDMTAGVAVAEVTGLWQLGREEGDLEGIGSAMAGGFHVGQGISHVNWSGEVLKRPHVLNETRVLYGLLSTGVIRSGTTKSWMGLCPCF